MPKIVERPRSLGVTCGIGSMLVGARQAGFEVLGNVEWRQYYHKEDAGGRNTFLTNFPGAAFPSFLDEVSEDVLEDWRGVDLVMGHPECGNFSNLGSSCKNRLERLKDPCDIPLFVDIVAKIKPRFFVMDDLPKSFGAFSMEEYCRRLPDYDLYPEWVSNYGYGNIQKNRKRMFMLGSLRSEGWVFVPGEVDHSVTVAQTLDDLPNPGEGFPNHELHVLGGKAGRARHLVSLGRDVVGTWRDLWRYFKDLKEGGVVEYVAADGSTKRRMGNSKGHWDKYAHVLDGSSCQVHPIRNLPYTIRERARIQGFPDDFIFYGTLLDEEGRWNHDKNVHMTKQTGKAMPVQFCRYVAGQIYSCIQGGESAGGTGVRLLSPNPDVDRAKRWYCSEVGYSDQEGACRRCWMAGRCEIRRDKYRIGLDVVSAPGPTTKNYLSIVTPIVKRKSVDPPKNGVSLPPVKIPLEIVRLSRPRETGCVTVDDVNVMRGQTPKDYHCRCQYCTGSVVIGELRGKDGSYYSRLDRRKYYDPVEHGPGGHLAKTPLHVARWAVQSYSEVGQWVLDPTAGAGTTLVESLVQGRNAAGMELQYCDVLRANVSKHALGSVKAILGMGDARDIKEFLSAVGRTYPLVVNNPPYFGDASGTLPNNPRKDEYQYDRSLPNLGLLKENDEYWRTIQDIYRSASRYLKDGGRFVVAVKDQMRNRKPDGLHERYGDLLSGIGLSHEGTAFLKHYPGTLHLHTYEKRYGVSPPLYQTILVFRKES